MNNIILKSKSIREYVCNELNKRSDEILEEQEINNIKQLRLDFKEYRSIENKFYIEDLEYFKKLKVCTFEGFFITEEIIEILNRLDSLEIIIFSHCKFETDKLIIAKINKLILTYSKINDFKNFIKCESLNKIEVIECEEIDIKELIFLSKLRELYIYNSKVKNSTMINNLKSLKELKLDGSLVDSVNFVKELNENIKYTYSKRYYLE